MMAAARSFHNYHQSECCSDKNHHQSEHCSDKSLNNRRPARGVKYAITCLPPTVADAALPLMRKWEHWRIENGLQHVKGATSGEDVRMIRRGQGPNVLTMLRDTALHRLHTTGGRTIAARWRHHCRYPDALLAFPRPPTPSAWISPRG